MAPHRGNTFICENIIVLLCHDKSLNNQTLCFIRQKTVYVWLDEFQPVQDVTVVRLGRRSPRDRTTPNPFYLLDGSDSGKQGC